MDKNTGVRSRKKAEKVLEEHVVEAKSVHGSIGWIKAGLISSLMTMILLSLVLWLIPSPIQPVAYSLPRPPPWIGPLLPNKHLQLASRLYANQIIGPESLVADGDYLYSGTADGKIVEIYKGELRVLTKLGKEPCGRFEDEPTCGRPLGLRIDSSGYLIVADAYLGLFKVNVATGDKTLLWPSSAPINGKVPRFLNDLDIAPDGTIYFTDSSTRWDRRNNRYLVLEGEDSGRLIAYHPASNTTEELFSGIAFANGVQLTRDKMSLLITSTTKAAVYKYHLSGPSKGKLDVFNDNLPGLPDNIRRSSLGGYWVPLSAVRKPAFSVTDFIAERPWIRSLVTKIFSQEVILKLVPPYGMVVHLNEQGEITMSLHDPTGSKIPSVSEVEDKAGILYMGSYSLPFLSKLYLNDVKDSSM